MSTHDMIVPLLALPDTPEIDVRVRNAGVIIRRGRVTESSSVRKFVQERWENWTDEVSVAFGHVPVRLFVAMKSGKPVGFACYDSGYLGLFGPTGVDPRWRGKGIGAGLLVRSLEAMREAGYLYAIIGAVGPADFYTKVVGAYSLPADWPNFTDADAS